MYVLVVEFHEDYSGPDVHGPFGTVTDAQIYAEQFRRANDLPIEATSENNDIWTDLGWYFGIFEPKKQEFK